jgi:hypothetical protein
MAWKACGGPRGLGIFKNNPEATEEDVWNNVKTHGDYPVNLNTKKGEVCADYVFGRMMKLYFKYDENGVYMDEFPPRPDYQEWCRVYHTHKELLEAAQKSLEEES